MNIDYIINVDSNPVFYDTISSYAFSGADSLFGRKKITSNEYLLIQHNTNTEYRLNVKTGALTQVNVGSAPGNISINSIDDDHVEVQCNGYVQKFSFLKTFEYNNNIDIYPTGEIRINDILNIEDTTFSLDVITVSRHTVDERVVTEYRAYYGKKTIKFDGDKLIDTSTGEEVSSYTGLLVIYDSIGQIIQVTPTPLTASTYKGLRSVIANFRPRMVKLLDVSKSPVYQVINLNNIDGGADTDNLKMAMLHNKVDDYIERW